MAVNWPIPGTIATLGRDVRATDMRLLAEAFNDLLRRAQNDRLIRTADGPISRSDAVYTTGLTTVSATSPSEAQDAIGYALSDAQDGEDVEVLRSGELEILIAAGLRVDYIADIDNAGDGQAIVTWKETVAGVTRSYTAPASTYKRRVERKRSESAPDLDELLRTARHVGFETRYRANGRGTFFLEIFVRPDGTRYTIES